MVRLLVHCRPPPLCSISTPFHSNRSPLFHLINCQSPSVVEVSPRSCSMRGTLVAFSCSRCVHCAVVHFSSIPPRVSPPALLCTSGRVAVSLSVTHSASVLSPCVVCSAKLKAHELREKGKDELLKQLDELKNELSQLRVAKVSGQGGPSKLAKMSAKQQPPHTNSTARSDRRM